MPSSAAPNSKKKPRSRRKRKNARRVFQTHAEETEDVEEQRAVTAPKPKRTSRMTAPSMQPAWATRANGNEHEQADDTRACRSSLLK